MKLGLSGIYNTFSVYEQVRLRKLNALREEARSQFIGLEKPGYESTFYLNIFKNYESVGLLTLCKENDKELRLKHLTLAPEFQVCDIEQEVMLYAEVWALEHGFTQTVIFAHELGIPFYVRLGYRKTGETVNENGRVCYKMVKKL